MDNTSYGTTKGAPAPSELLSISAFARRVGLAPSALRFYDDCRVLQPAHVDGATGYRYYSPGQEARARLLRGLRMAGLALADAGVVLDGSAADARTVLERHRETVRDRSRAVDATIGDILRSLDSPESEAESGAGSPESNTVVRIGGPELASAVRQVVPAVGRDEEHPVLGRVLVEIDGAEVRLVATDRYRLSLRILNPAAVAGPSRRLLLEASELIALAAWATRHPEVTIEAGPDGAKARATDGTDRTGTYDKSAARELALSDGQFPSYRDMLSDLAPPQHRVIVDRSALLDSVHTLASGPDGTPGIVLRLGQDKVTVTHLDGSDSAALPAVVLGEPSLRIGFDPAVLAPALEASVGPDVLLEISSAVLPVLVRSADQGSFTTLVMPIAL